MTKRKKRLEKGIESIAEQIKIHHKKERKAVEEGDLELVGYYEKEIKTLEQNKKKKEEQIKKV